MTRKLYRILFDGEPDYIEATSFGKAIKLWRDNIIDENEPGVIAEDEEPESVELIHEKGVIREH